MPSRSLKGGQRRWRLDRLEMPALEEIEPRSRRRIMRQAVRPVALEARRTAPDSGFAHKRKLNRSIRYDVLDQGKTGRVKATAPHAHLVHDGTKPHMIRAARGGVLLYRLAGRQYFAQAVRHPGARANPWLVEAGERMRPELERIMRDCVEAALVEVVG